MTLDARCVLVLTVVIGPGVATADDAPTQRPRPITSSATVYKERIDPHWFADDTRLWYRNDLKGGRKEFIRVDAEKGTREPAFDHVKLAAGLSKATDQKFTADRLPFQEITFADGEQTILFRAAGKDWRCDRTSYRCTVVTSAKRAGEPVAYRTQSPNPFRRQPDRDRESPSPDGQWTAFIRDYNVFVRAKGATDAVPLSKVGVEGNAFGMLSWTPDGSALVAFRIEPGEAKDVHLIESSPRGGGRAILRSRPYPLPGDKFTAYEPWVFDPAARTAVKVDTDRVDFGRPRLHWLRDGRRFAYEKVDRGHQRFRLVAVDAHTGLARNLVDEKSTTFLWTAHTDAANVPLVTWLDDTEELIYASEKDGWRHLYLVNTVTGGVKHPITTGPWVVRGIDHVDPATRQIWFRASGMNPGQDPYFIHYYRVRFDGSGLVPLTSGNGTHTAQFSPTRKYLIDTSSRVDAPPVHDLRRTSDGKQVVRLEEADASEPRTNGWVPPEVFTAKGRDGATDIWGVVYRPKDFDPAKKYPVIEHIYAGPHGSFVPKAFSTYSRFADLTDLGFVVVQVDGMGTANRSKAFHDVCWKNLKDAGFPDRILWHKALAAKYPWYDVSRVGITGGSAGGQNATAAVLFHGDFYKAAVAGCGCHDNRMDKASWNEQWMGYPVGPQYAASSNIDNAHRLTGKLLLIVGELDTNVPPESTYRLCDALIKAGKDFDFVLVPGAGHGMGGTYGQRRLRDFFVRHLQAKEPPDRNAAITSRQ